MNEINAHGENTYYTSIRDKAKRRKGHSRLYMGNAVIQKSLFHIHLTMEAFSVLAVCFLITSFLRHVAMLLCFARTPPFEP